ncbi:MAG: protease modulator HflK N-terminal domain-containing protein, partial [Burkholderiaceae bacterium]|nr:protease modulator HflK N-terminal domain-containing protein [Burkholderiaceae bacterium]
MSTSLPAPTTPSLPERRPWIALARAAFALLTGLLRAARIRIFSSGRGDGPPDLDELWRDFNKKLGGLFGGKTGQRGGNSGGGGNGGGPGFQPDMKSAGIGALLIGAVVLLIWLGSGFFIV